MSGVGGLPLTMLLEVTLQAMHLCVMADDVGC